MKLEDQVCSLELAKKLKELGVKQKSIFYHWHVNKGNRGANWEVSMFAPSDEAIHSGEAVSAFSVAELVCELQRVAEQDIVIARSDDKPADTLAKILISKYAQKGEVQG
jgi:hypothetical protein